MADIQTQLPIKITDGTNTAAISGSSALKVDASAVTQPVSGTVTLSSQTVTLSSQTVTLSSQTITAAQSGTWTVGTNADANIAAGTAPAKSLVAAGVYNTAQSTLTSGQSIALQSDINGNLKVAGTLTTSPSGTQTISGTVTGVPSGTQTVTPASGFNVTLSSQTVTLSSQTITAAQSGTWNVTLSSQTVTLSSQTITAAQSGTWTVGSNADANVAAGTAPAKALLGAVVYNATQPTLTTGQTVATQSDINGNQRVVLSGMSTVTTVPSGTQTVTPASGFNVTLSSQTVTLSSQTVTAVQSGTWNVTLSSQTVTLAAGSAAIGTVTTNADANLAPGTAPAKALVGAAVYNSASPTLTTGQTVALQSDVNGNLKVAGTLTTSPSGTQTVSGTVTLSSQTVTLSSQTVTAVQSGTWTVATNADATIAAGTAPAKSLVAAGVYNTAQSTLTSGQSIALQSDINGNLKVQAVSGFNVTLSSNTVTLSSQTVTLSSNTVTLSSQTMTLAAGSASIGTVATNAETGTAPGAAPTKALLGAIIYNSASPTLTTGQTVALQSDVNGNLKVAGTLTTSPSGTQTVSGTVTLSSQTVTLSSQTVTAVQSGTWTVATNADANIAAGTAPAKSLVAAGVYNTAQPTLTSGQSIALQSDINGNLKVAGTLTTSPSGTQTISGSVTLATGSATIGSVTSIPSGTQTVAAGSGFNVTLSSQTVTLSSNTVTLATGTASIGSVTAVPETSGVVASYATSPTIAAASTGTLSYTVTAAKTLYWKGIMASSSGGPCKVTVLNGGATFAVGFYSTTTPFLNIVFPQPLIVSAGVVVQILIQNNAGAAQDVYGTFFGAEH